MRSKIAQSNWCRPMARITMALALTAACALPAAADQWNKRTTITFSAPVEIPGKVLPAGTYTFRILDVTADRDVVQVMNKNQNHLDATIMAIPDYRVKTPTKTIVQFEERPAHTPEAVKAWFYPGDNYGVQFVYPHDQAVKIAQRTHQNVLAMRNEMAKNITAPSKSKSDPSVRELETTEVTGVSPSGQTIDVSSVIVRQEGQGQSAATRNQKNQSGQADRSR